MDFRLTPEVYEKLEEMLPKPMVNKQTSEQEVGYLLGIQYVLSILRKDFTIERDSSRGASFPISKRPLLHSGK